MAIPAYVFEKFGRYTRHTFTGTIAAGNLTIDAALPENKSSGRGSAPAGQLMSVVASGAGADGTPDMSIHNVDLPDNVDGDVIATISNMSTTVFTHLSFGMVVLAGLPKIVITGGVTDDVIRITMWTRN